MNILITGGGIANKGAQAMLFITVEQMQKRFPQDRVIVLTVTDSDFSNYRFDVKRVSLYAIKYIAKSINILKLALHRVNPKQIIDIENVFRNARLLVDISGYALGSNWADGIVDYYLSCFECAKRFDVPVYIMPQSFGPLDYPKDSVMMKRIASTMAYPKIIYAREKEGYDMLTERFELKNVRTSCDMVLRTQSASPLNIYKRLPQEIRLPNIGNNSVAIIPNVRICDHIGLDETIRYYCEIAREVLKTGDTLYILHHSSEDAPLCDQIMQSLGANNRVVLLSDDYDCFKYEALVQRFDYIIASRYHAIVHALKNCVPCIAVGWATKYHELLTLFDLQEYVFDVRDEVGENDFQESIANMNATYKVCANRIRKIMEGIQQNDLFDCIG